MKKTLVFAVLMAILGGLILFAGCSVSQGLRKAINEIQYPEIQFRGGEVGMLVWDPNTGKRRMIWRWESKKPVEKPVFVVSVDDAPLFIPGKTEVFSCGGKINSEEKTIFITPLDTDDKFVWEDWRDVILKEFVRSGGCYRLYSNKATRELAN